MGICCADGIAAVIGDLPKSSNPVERFAMRGRQMPGQHDVSAELANQAAVSLDRRGEAFGTEREQGRMGRVEHGVIGAAAGAVRVTGA